MRHLFFFEDLRQYNGPYAGIQVAEQLRRGLWRLDPSFERVQWINEGVHSELCFEVSATDPSGAAYIIIIDLKDAPQRRNRPK